MRKSLCRLLALALIVPALSAAGPRRHAARARGPRRERPGACPAAAADDRERPPHGRAPGRREHGTPGLPGARAGGARRLPLAQPGRGRAERDRARARRESRRGAHRGAARGAQARRGRAVLHARLRLRLHALGRGDVQEVGPGGSPRRHGARHPDDAAAGGRQRLQRHLARRPRPAPGGGGAHARGDQSGRRHQSLPRADQRRLAAVAGAQSLRARLRSGAGAGRGL